MPSSTRARALRASVGDGSRPPLIKTYERMTVPGPYAPDAASAGRRSLRNVALDSAGGGGGA